MILTYQYRLLPTKRQHRALESILESQRQLYNAALEERIGAYRRGVTRGYIDQSRALTEWRQSDPEAAAMPVSLQRATLKQLDDAYKGFFRRVKQKGAKAGFPRFRGRGWWDSFGFRQFSGISLDGARLRFNGMPGALKVHLHRPLGGDGRIRSCTFRRDTKGWKVGFAVEVECATPRAGERMVGVDLGVTKFAALSDGGFIPSLRAARRAERRLRIAQRALARKQRGSGNRRKARAYTARCHAATACRRLNHLHQAAARLVRDYDVISVEALNIKGLARGTLARDVHDASWAKFISLLRYKAAKAGACLVEVDPRNSSQDCSDCGERVLKGLEERHHDCPRCGLSIDRDLNAARNILNRAGVRPGLRNVADCGMRAGGNIGRSDEPHQFTRRAN
jgi:putative transposase